MSDQDGNEPKGTNPIAEIIRSISGIPAQLAVPFLDAAARALATAYEPIDRHRVARAQLKVTKIATKRRDLARPYDDEYSKIIMDSLLSSLDTLPAEKKLALVKEIFSDTNLSKAINSKRDNRIAVFNRIPKHLENAHVDPDKVVRLDPDFIDAFTDTVERVSDERLQELWSQIFVEKIINPEKVTKRTIDVLRSIDFTEADKFRKFCSLVLDIEGKKISVRLDKGGTDAYLGFAKLEYDDLLELNEARLVNLGVRKFEVEAGSKFEYFGKKYQATTSFLFQTNPLTPVGDVLYSIASKEGIIEENKAYITKVFEQFGKNVVPLDTR